GPVAEGVETTWRSSSLHTPRMGCAEGKKLRSATLRPTLSVQAATPPELLIFADSRASAECTQQPLHDSDSHTKTRPMIRALERLIWLPSTAQHGGRRVHRDRSTYYADTVRQGWTPCAKGGHGDARRRYGSRTPGGSDDGSD